ncbi:TolC family protein [Saccharicrinis aurantiacus]|uniref:TolC family protein n=1 Tax=Saccharicrinis aurantiacus TaxID=1849719 RepID=UPI0009F81587|nr:TolC family protein [Saccharicrinis aurantiacus]
MNKMKILISIIITFTLFGYCPAQDSLAIDSNTWSLQRCIEHSFENNLTVKRQMLNVDVQKNELKQNKLNRLPDLNARLSGGYNFGLTWIQQEGQNIDANNSYVSPSLSSNIPIYQGLAINNSIKKSEYDLLSATETTNKIKNDISLQITAQFLQIILNKELLNVAEKQYETTELQVERTNNLVKAGSVAKGNLLEIKSQAAKEALVVTQQKNELTISLLTLAQLLDIERPVNFDITTPDMPEMATEFAEQLPNIIYDRAVENMPEIKSAEYSVTSTEYDLKITKGGLQPTLGVGMGMDSRASWLLDDPNNVNRDFLDQLESSRNIYIGAQLNIPIFGRLQTRTNISNAEIRVMDAKYQLQIQKLTLIKEIQQAYVDALASYNKYLSSLEAVESFKESFKYTEQRFNVGMVNSVDYNVAKTDYTRAQSNLLQSKYEYVLRTKILDFYNGIPIEL